MNSFRRSLAFTGVLGFLVIAVDGCVRVGTGAPVRSARPTPALAATQPSATTTPIEREPVAEQEEQASPDSRTVLPDERAERGTASWYGEAHHGKTTASGEPFDMYAMTAAHPTLDMGTRVEVENLGNGRTVIVRINDRGPFTGDRVIDVSMAAAQALGFVAAGTAEVEIRLLR